MEQFHENCIPIFFHILFAFREKKAQYGLSVCAVRTKRCFNQKNIYVQKERKIKEHENRECAIKGEDTISAL
jgi:hypothetical protein